MSWLGGFGHHREQFGEIYVAWHAALQASPDCEYCSSFKMTLGSWWLIAIPIGLDVPIKGGNLVKSWPRTQMSIAISTAWEASLFKQCVWSTLQQALGNMRHLDTGFVWIQQVSAEKVTQFGKVDGATNPSGILTMFPASSLRDILPRCPVLSLLV